MGELPTMWRDEVRAEWVDRNGHLNVGYYMVIFDEATTRFFDYCGMDDGFRRRQRIATFTLEAHATYERELRLGDPLRVNTQLIGWSDKKIHYFHRMFHAEEEYLAATNELLSLYVHLDTRRSAPFAPEILARLQVILCEQGALPAPRQLGRLIGVDQRPPGGG